MRMFHADDDISSDQHPPASRGELITPLLTMKLLRSICTLAFSVSATRGFTVGPTSNAVRPSSLRLMMSTSAIDFAKQEISSNKVVVFSKSACPFCKRTKALLESKGINYKLYELNEMENGSDIQAALLEISGQRTVPNVFINGEHLGGNDDTQAAAASGKLDEMLKK